MGYDLKRILAYAVFLGILLLGIVMLVQYNDEPALRMPSFEGQEEGGMDFSIEKKEKGQQEQQEQEQRQEEEKKQEQ